MRVPSVNLCPRGRPIFFIFPPSLCQSHKGASRHRMRAVGANCRAGAGASLARSTDHCSLLHACYRLSLALAALACHSSE